MTASQRQPVSLEARVSSIERDAEHLARGLADIDRKIDRYYESTHEQLQSLTMRVSRQSQVNWPLVVALFLALFTGMSMIGGGLMFVGNLALKPLETELRWMKEDLRRRETQPSASGGAPHVFAPQPRTAPPP